MVGRCWVNFLCRGVLPICIRVGQGPIVLTIGAGGGCLDIFSLVYHFSFLSSSLWEMAQYRLKYCLKGLLSPKQPNNQPIICCTQLWIIFSDCVFLDYQMCSWLYWGGTTRSRRIAGKLKLEQRWCVVLNKCVSSFPRAYTYLFD